MNKVDVKTIAFYLPQFYPFPENDAWWGEGFTEWTNVKKAKPLFKGHYQPTVPLDENYYCLSDIDTMRWQVDLAKQYGVYGFCFYHYWFGDNRQLMEKPVDLYAKHLELDLPFCLCWANHNWTRTWVGGDKEILMDMKYGDEKEWEAHFQYLLPFFKDKRYIEIDNKPVLLIYLPQDIIELKKMVCFLKKRAVEEGLSGLTIVSQNYFTMKNSIVNGSIDYFIQYEPNCSLNSIYENIGHGRLVYLPFSIDCFMYRVKGAIKRITKGKICHYRTYRYSSIWKYILKRSVMDDRMIAGGFVKCDVTPRRQDRALIFRGASPHSFALFFDRLVKKVQRDYKQQFIFLSAWNEWGEGMYLEPDEKDGYRYLEAIQRAVQ